MVGCSAEQSGDWDGATPVRDMTVSDKGLSHTRPTHIIYICVYVWGMLYLITIRLVCVVHVLVEPVTARYGPSVCVLFYLRHRGKPRSI